MTCRHARIRPISLDVATSKVAWSCPLFATLQSFAIPSGKNSPQWPTYALKPIPGMTLTLWLL